MSFTLRTIVLVAVHWILTSRARRLHPISEQASSDLSVTHNVPNEDDVTAHASHCGSQHKQLQASSQAAPQRTYDLLAMLVLSLTHPGAGYQVAGQGCKFATHNRGTRPKNCARSRTSLVRCEDISLQFQDSRGADPNSCDRHARLQGHLTSNLGLGQQNSLIEGQRKSHRNWRLFLLAAAATLGTLLATTSTVLATGGTFPDAADKSFDKILVRSFKKALGGGISGFLAAVIQVLSLMWLDTTTKYQHRYGGNLKSSLKALISEGGVFRLYRGLPMALVNLPLIRGGQMAANEGVLALLDSLPRTAALSLVAKNLAVTLAAASWRIFCLPVDTLQVSLQVGGRDGWKALLRNITQQGPGVLFNGKTSVVAFALAGSFPWYMTFNYFDKVLPLPSTDAVLLLLLRSAFLGLSASCASDIVSNSMRVIMTNQQASMMSIGEALGLVIQKDGIKGLFGRGLKTRLIMNGFQTAVFSVLWKYFQAAGGAR